MPTNKTVLDNKKIDEIISAIKEGKHCNCNHGSSSGNAVYGLGIMGMIIYYFHHMPSSNDMLMTILKIIFWPAFLLYHLLETSFF